MPVAQRSKTGRNTSTFPCPKHRLTTQEENNPEFLAMFQAEKAKREEQESERNPSNAKMAKLLHFVRHQYKEVLNRRFRGSKRESSDLETVTNSTRHRELPTKVIPETPKAQQPKHIMDQEYMPSKLEDEALHSCIKDSARAITNEEIESFRQRKAQTKHVWVTPNRPTRLFVATPTLRQELITIPETDVPRLPPTVQSHVVKHSMFSESQASTVMIRAESSSRDSAFPPPSRPFKANPNSVPSWLSRLPESESQFVNDLDPGPTPIKKDVSRENNRKMREGW
jgi:hypothetical protein